MAKNNIATREAGEALGRALAKNSVLKELDISGDGWFDGIDGPGFAKGIADGVKTNGAMAKFTFSGMVGTREGPPVTVETSMTEADFSKKKLGASGAIMLAAFLPKCQ